MITVRLPEPLRNGHEMMVVNDSVHTLGELISVLERDLPHFADDRDELFNFAFKPRAFFH